MQQMDLYIFLKCFVFPIQTKGICLLSFHKLCIHMQHLDARALLERNSSLC